MKNSTHDILPQRIRTIVEAAGTAKQFTGYSQVVFRDEHVELVINRDGRLRDFRLGPASEIESMSNEALELLVAKNF
jgi:hypothetical protein